MDASWKLGRVFRVHEKIPHEHSLVSGFHHNKPQNLLNPPSSQAVTSDWERWTTWQLLKVKPHHLDQASMVSCTMNPASSMLVEGTWIAQKCTVYLVVITLIYVNLRLIYVWLSTDRWGLFSDEHNLYNYQMSQHNVVLTGTLQVKEGGWQE